MSLVPFELLTVHVYNDVSQLVVVDDVCFTFIADVIVIVILLLYHFMAARNELL